MIDVESRDLEGAREGGKGEGGVAAKRAGGGEGVATSRGRASDLRHNAGAVKTC